MAGCVLVRRCESDLALRIRNCFQCCCGRANRSERPQLPCLGIPFVRCRVPGRSYDVNASPSINRRPRQAQNPTFRVIVLLKVVARSSRSDSHTRTGIRCHVIHIFFANICERVSHRSEGSNYETNNKARQCACLSARSLCTSLDQLFQNLCENENEQTEKSNKSSLGQ